MAIFQAFILGLVQGITELLPVSSSGHLVVIPVLFGWSPHSLAFDTTLHLGTALALIIYFRKDLLTIIKALFRDLKEKGFAYQQYSEDSSLGIKILIGSVPAGIIGLIWEKTITSNVSVACVLTFLLLGTLLMILAEIFGKGKISEVKNVSRMNSFFIGLFQSLALLSGVSRSGATISGAMLLGVKREVAAKFSFLLSIPIVLSAGLFELRHVFTQTAGTSFLPLLVGFFTSFVFSVLSVKFLLSFLKNHKLNVFIWYRLILALLLLIFVMLK